LPLSNFHLVGIPILPLSGQIIIYLITHPLLALALESSDYQTFFWQTIEPQRFTSKFFLRSHLQDRLLPLFEFWSMEQKRYIYNLNRTTLTTDNQPLMTTLQACTLGAAREECITALSCISHTAPGWFAKVHTSRLRVMRATPAAQLRSGWDTSAGACHGVPAKVRPMDGSTLRRAAFAPGPVGADG
jgi:hypothetical protein